MQPMYGVAPALCRAALLLLLLPNNSETRPATTEHTNEDVALSSVETTLLPLQTPPGDAGLEEVEAVDLGDPVAVRTLFEAWTRRHGKAYSGAAEQSQALNQFNVTLQQIQRHNSASSTYRIGLNAYSDWRWDEVRTRLCGYKPNKNVTLFGAEGGGAVGGGSPAAASVVSTIDWVTAGYVTPVKTQGNCASCWAFSATGGLEGAYFRYTRRLVSLSEQELVDCDSPYIGCGGGVMTGALNYVRLYKGLATEAIYPYISAGGQHGSCRRNAATAETMTVTFINLIPGDDVGLLAALTTNGPIPVAVAVASAFTNYQSGVFQPSGCGSVLNHGMLLVGSGTDSTTGLKYWKLKNSWGASWGEAGYIRIAMSASNACGISSAAAEVSVS